MIPNLGCENTAVQLGNPIAPAQRTAGRNTPRLEYDFYTFEQGSVDVYTYVLPTFPISKDRGYAGHEATNVETKIWCMYRRRSGNDSIYFFFRICPDLV